MSAVALVLALVLAAAGDEAVALNDRARAALDAGRPADAVLLLQQAVELRPEDAVLRKNLAYAYFARGQAHEQAFRFDDAQADWRKAQERNPDEPGFGLHLGHLLLRRYRLEEARATLAAITLRHAGLAQGWLMLGDALDLLDRLPEAIAAYEEAAERCTSAPPEDAATCVLARDALERARRQHAIEKDYLTDETGSFVLRHPRDVEGPLYGVRLAGVLERARADVCSLLDVTPAGRAVVLLYPPADFQAATGAHDWVGGLFDRKIRLPIADVEADAPRIESAFRHEFCHLVVSEIAPTCPTLLNEGLAQVAEHGRGGGLERLVAWLDARPGGRAALPALADLPDTFLGLGTAEDAARAYLVSYAFVDHVVQLHGMAAVMAWVREVAQQPLEPAYQRATGRSLQDEEALFRERLRSAR